MIKDGCEWMARALAEAAVEVQCLTDDRDDHWYAHGVADVLRWLAGDIPPTPVLEAIHQRYQNSMDPEGR